MSIQFIIILFVLLLFAGSFVMFASFRSGNIEKLIYEKQSLYHDIKVYESGTIRTLRLGDEPDAGKQSRIDISDLDLHLLEYTQIIFAGLLVNPEPERVLIIGMGGGVIPRTLRNHYPDCRIDVVDIDPDVVETAQKYFYFTPDANTRVNISDGRLFVVRQIEENPEHKYDMIILDAFNMDSIPLHLVTREFLMQVRSILDSKGVVVANILSYTTLFSSEVMTYRNVFDNCSLFPGKEAKNTIIVSAGSDVPSLDFENVLMRAEQLQRKHRFSFSIKAVARRFRPGCNSGGRAAILTDEMLINS